MPRSVYFYSMRIPHTLLICLSAQLVLAQAPRFEKFAIGNSGCAVYAPGDPMFEFSYSEDSSVVYTGEVAVDSFHFIIICVDLRESVGDDAAVKTDLLISYLDYLKQAFDITASAGYGTGHTLEGSTTTVGVIDFWEDAFGGQWQVKGWVDSGYLAVLGINGPTEYPYFNAAQLFLNGFRLPGM